MCLVQIAVVNIGGSGLDPRFCTVTLSQAPGGTMQNTTPHTLDGTMPAGSMVIAYAHFSEKCGWLFDHWDVTTQNLTRGTSSTVTVRDNPASVRVSLAGVSDGDSIAVFLRAFGTYNGTGKIMRSSVDGTKLLRVGEKLVRDI